MDRRDFVALSALAGTALALDPPTLSAEELFAEEQQRQSGPDPAKDWGADGTIEVRITSELMEDYTPGKPVPATVRPIWQNHLPYVSQDGTEQFFVFPAARTPGGAATRIYPSADGITGWETDTATVPVDGPGGVIVPGMAGVPDQLVSWRNGGPQFADLGPDGAIGTLHAAPGGATGGLVRGTLPPNTRYVPEVSTSTGRLVYGLRSRTAPFNFIPIENVVSFGLGYSALGGQSVFPLQNLIDGIYRCVTVEINGDLNYLHLELDVAQNVFRVMHRNAIGHTSTGVVWVDEHVAGQVQVVSFELPQIVAVKGTFDPMSKNTPSWNASTSTLPGVFPAALDMTLSKQAFPQMYRDPVGAAVAMGGWNDAGQALEIMFLVWRSDYLFDVWTTVQRQNGTWDAVELLDRQWQTVGMMPGAANYTIVVAKQGTGFEKWVRDEQGEWNDSHVRVPNDDVDVLKAAGYRVGINMRSKGIPVAGELLSLTASSSSSAVLNHEYRTLGVHRAVAAQTDTNGVLWVTVLLQDRLNLPSIFVNSKHFQTQLAIDLNHSIESFFVGMTEDKLVNATDPSTGQKILQHPENAKDAADNIGRVFKLAPAVVAGIEPGAGHPKLTADLPVRWMPASFDPTATRVRVVHDPEDCWCFEVVDGVMRSRTLTREEASAMVAMRRTELGVEGGFDIFSDAIDFFGNLGQAIWNGVCNVVKAVVQGTSLLLEIVVDSVHFLYNGIIDTIDRILDVVGFVLDAAGMLLGQAIGWLLEQLGFLFDWKAIKRRRDALKTLISSNAGMFTKAIPDPKGGTDAMVAALGTVRTALQAFRSTKPATSSYSGTFSGMSSLAGVFEFGGDCVLPQATWMMDKVQSFLPKSPGLGLPGGDDFAAAQLAFVNAMVSVSSKLTVDTSGLISVVLQWVADGAVFGNASMQPLVDWLIAQLDSVIAAIQGLAGAAGDALHLAWANPGKVIQWMDSPISIRFFSSFYKGLTGNTFSLFDLTCLLAAIPDTAVDENTQERKSMRLAGATPWHRPQPAAPSPYGMKARLEMAGYRLPGRPKPWQGGGEALLFSEAFAEGMDTKDQANAAALAFMTMGIFTTGFDSFTAAIGLGESVVGNFTTGLNLAMTIASTMCMTVAGGDTNEIIATSFAIGGSIWLFVGLTQLRGIQLPKEVVDVALIGAAAYFLYKATDKDKQGQLIAYHSVALTQQVLSLAVRFRVLRQKKPLPPLPSGAIYGMVQGVMALAKMELYAFMI